MCGGYRYGMSLHEWLDRTPRWVIVALGAAVGITICSIILLHAITSGEETTIGTFAMAHFAGYLFFIISPVEILYVHMLSEEHSLSLLVGLAIGTAMAAQLIDYGIGYAFSGTVIDKVIGLKKYEIYEQRIDGYGGATIFLFCLLPLSSPIIVLVAGMIRYPLRWMLLFSFAGLSIKSLFLVWVFT